MDQGKYEEAKKTFGQSLAIKQAIGDRAGEAATFYQLGFLALKGGSRDIGLRLIAICCTIEKSIEHGDTRKDFETLATLASQSGYGEKDLYLLMNDAWDAYQKDQGKGLIEAMSVENEASSTKGPLSRFFGLFSGGNRKK